MLVREAPPPVHVVDARKRKRARSGFAWIAWTVPASWSTFTPLRAVGAGAARGAGEKTVEQLAAASSTPVKNTSAHLRVLRQARLVETRRDGSYVYYRLADDDVFRFLRDLQALGRSRLAEVEQVARRYIDGRDGLE